MNQLLSQRGFNARVEILVEEQIVYLARLSERQKSGQPCDLFFLPAGQYEGFVERGLLLPLHSNTGLPGAQIDRLAGRLWSGLPETAWEGLRRSGTVYAVPNQGSWARPSGVSIRDDIVQALSLQPGLDALRSYGDLTPILEKIHQAILDGSLAGAGVANCDQIRQVFGQTSLLQPYTAGYDVLAAPFVVYHDDPQAQIVNWFRMAAFEEQAHLRRLWQEAGYGPAEPLTPDEVIAGYSSGRFVVEVGRPVWPDSVPRPSVRFGYPWIDIPLGPAFLVTSDIQSSLTGLHPGLAGDPERLRRVAVLLDWFHSEPDLVNVLAYGIEGEHWRWLDAETKVITLIPGSHYFPDFLTQVGDQTLLYSVSPQPAGWGHALRQANAQAPASPALGFSFDRRPAAGEAAALQALQREWLDPLEHGQVENIALQIDRMVQALESAGLEVVQGEVEQQFDAWRSAGR